MSYNKSIITQKSDKTDEKCTSDISEYPKPLTETNNWILVTSSKKSAHPNHSGKYKGQYSIASKGSNNQSCITANGYSRQICNNDTSDYNFYNSNTGYLKTGRQPIYTESENITNRIYVDANNGNENTSLKKNAIYDAHIGIDTEIQDYDMLKYKNENYKKILCKTTKKKQS